MYLHMYAYTYMAHTHPNQSYFIDTYMLDTTAPWELKCSDKHACWLLQLLLPDCVCLSSYSPIPSS